MPLPVGLKGCGTGWDRTNISRFSGERIDLLCYWTKWERKDSNLQPCRLRRLQRRAYSSCATLPLEAPAGVEPANAVLQTATLPLGQGALMCPVRDSNPHPCGPVPKTGASTNFANRAVKEEAPKLCEQGGFVCVQVPLPDTARCPRSKEQI